MLQFNEANRDQYIQGGESYITEIKLEDGEESCYYANSNKFLNPNYNTDFKMPPISSFCSTTSTSEYYGNNNIVRGRFIASSDGECSPTSVDENDVPENMRSSVPCVRGVRTITRNPGRITRHRNQGPTRSRGRSRKTASTAPKEKDRARLFNEAFDGLRKRIPSIPASKKLSKIEILRLAICYMAYLKFLLESDLPQRNSIETSADIITNSSNRDTEILEETCTHGNKL